MCTAEQVLEIECIASLYELYLSAFEPLLESAAARHVLTYAEFSCEMRDERIDKYVVWDETSTPVGMVTLTRDLSAIPWISRQYYRSRFSDAAERGALYYLGYILVGQSHRRTSVLLTLTDQVNRRLAASKGVLGFDLCGQNDKEGIGRLARRLLGSSKEIELLDTQHYYAADYQ